MRTTTIVDGPATARPRRRAAWRRAGRGTSVLAALALTAGGLVGAVSAGAPASAAVRSSDATFLSSFPAPVAPVYNASTAPGPGSDAGRPTSARTATAAAAVRATCAGDQPLAAAQWYALPASGASRLSAARQSGDRYDPDQAPVSFGWVTADTAEVLSCGESVNLPPQRAVLFVAYFAEERPRCVNGDDSWFDCDAVVALATLHQTALTPPANDAWQKATAIAGDAFSTTVDTTAATFDGLGPVREGYCFLSNISPVTLGNVWYRYTPSFSGHVNVVARSAKPGYWAWPVIAELGPDGPIEPGFDDAGECVGTSTVEAGKTYLIGVGGWYDPYYGEDNPIGGDVSLSVSRTSEPSLVRDLRVSTDPAAHSATVSWFGRWDDTPATGLRLTRTGPEGTTSTVVGPDTRSYTFTGLKGWEPYLLGVETLGTGGLTPPRATRLVYLPDARPSRTLGVEARLSGIRRVTVSWREPAFEGDHAISGYRIREFRGSAATATRSWTVPASSRSFTATGVAFRRDNRYDVTALNSAGAGLPSARTASIRFTGIPTAARVVTAKAVSTRATLRWKVPANTRGAKITGYVVTRNGKNARGTGPRSVTVPASARSKAFLHLVRGRTYRLSVRAVTTEGRGPKVSVTVTVPKKKR